MRQGVPAISTPQNCLVRRSWSATAAGVALLLVVSLSAVAVTSRAATPPVTEAHSGPVRAEASPQIFATMCALYAAGFESESSVPQDDPAISKLRDQLVALHGPATEALRQFYKAHILSDPGETMSRYISYALVLGPPPKFRILSGTGDLPPDVLELEGFADILTDFYKEAKIEDLWNQFQPAYNQGVDSVRVPLGTVAQLETGYLRDVVPSDGRTFTVYVEPLVGGRTNVRNIGDQYAIVVSPAALSLDQIRHAFLHFMLDPLPLLYAKNIHVDAPLLQYAAKAPRLPVEFRDDFPAFFTECFVRAVELRLRHLSPEGEALQVSDADVQGFVLVRPILASLVKFEHDTPAMRFYFPDIVRSIDLAAETNRVQTLAFSPGAPAEEAVGAEPNAGVRSRPALSQDLMAALAEGERQIAAQDAAGAAATFQRVLDKAPGQPRALYGLAVAFVLQGKATRAMELFQQIVNAAAPANGASQNGVNQPDPVALSWSHLYLGRIHDMQGDRDQALQEYRAALAVGDAPPAARTAAQHGIEQGYQPATRDQPTQ